MLPETNTTDGLRDLAEEFMYSAGPTKIDHEQFNDMLNVLPPVRWTRMSSTESFLMSELYIGSITDHYVRVDETYFVIRGCYKRLNHQLLIILINNGQTIADYLQSVYQTPPTQQSIKCELVP